MKINIVGGHDSIFTFSEMQTSIIQMTVRILHSLQKQNSSKSLVLLPDPNSCQEQLMKVLGSLFHGYALQSFSGTVPVHSTFLRNTANRECCSLEIAVGDEQTQSKDDINPSSNKSLEGTFFQQTFKLLHMLFKVSGCRPPPLSQSESREIAMTHYSFQLLLQSCYSMP